MNKEVRQQNLSRLFLTCETLEELHEFARMFNSQYKVMLDHRERMEVLNNAVH